MLIRCIILCAVLVQIRSQNFGRKGFFDLDNVIGNLFPNLQPGAAGNPSANYPGAPTNYPINGGQTNNPQGNIWNNGNGNPGVNYPANSQYYPGNGIQTRWPPRNPGNLNNWNNPGSSAGLPSNGIQGRPQYPGSGSNWNGANSNYPNVQTVPGNVQDRPYPGQGYVGQNPSVNFPGNNQYPNNNNNDKLQKLNPNYPGARNNWNNGAVNPGINYLGNTQTYPANGIQGPNSVASQPWNPNNRLQNLQTGETGLGLQNNQNQINAPGNTFEGFPNEGQAFGQQTPGFNRGPAQESPFNTGFRHEALQYPNQSGLTDDSASTDKVAILGHPVIISNITPPAEFKRGPLDPTQCVQDCPTSTRYEPVCGSDNITYYNREKFECAVKCGVDVMIVRKGPCDA
ncbi:GATA zinc finger domain-containing protein 14-like isoform X1 [Colias croceus]|uniref:GATA zinc finger domain-containing protein 14-like isoform X1 n=1 Tax=Colias crocea TaxID=72248 RepID=UPI001E280740|nr:GATA zinc finger domain-containing protein 14-like isoform X1 [Colias croceus]